MRCGTTHHNHPEPDIVVTVVWIVVVTVSGTGVVLVVVPRAAAQHTSVARLPQASKTIPEVNFSGKRSACHQKFAAIAHSAKGRDSATAAPAGNRDQWT